MAPRTGDFGKWIEKRRGNRVALSGEGSQGEPPGPEAGAQAPSAGPADAAARRRAERRVPGRGAGRTGWARRGSRGRAGEIPGRAPWDLGSGDPAARGPRVRGAAARASPPAPGSPSAPRPRETPRRPRLRRAEKLPWLGRSRARGGVGTARRTSSGRCAGGAGVGRKPQTRAARAAPRPPLQGTRRLGGAARGHTPSERAPRTGLLPTRIPAAGEGAAAVLQDSYLLATFSSGRGDNASIRLPIALAIGCPLR